MLQSQVQLNSIKKSSKKLFSDKICYKAKAFLEQDNCFIFERVLKIKDNKRTHSRRPRVSITLAT